MDETSKIAGGPDPTTETTTSQATKKIGLSRKASAGRVIKSRFKEAAARVATESNSSANNSGKNSFGSSNTLTNSGTKVRPSTSSGGAKKKATGGSSSNAIRSLARHRLYASSLTLNNSNNKTLTSSGSSTNGSTNDSGGSNTPRSRAGRRPFGDTAPSGSTVSGGSSNSSGGGAATFTRTAPLTSTMASSISNKLHSTAVNATMLNTTILPGNSSQLSSSVVSHRSRVLSNNLPELPDISAIKLDTTACSSGSRGGDSVAASATPPLLSVGEGGPLHSPCDVIAEEQDEQEQPVTSDELQMAHLNYLTWCHLNASATSAHAAALAPAAKELCFLEELVSAKQREASELRQKLQLLDTLQQAKEAHQALLPVLQQLNDGSERWCEGLTSLSQQLEHHLHHVALSPALLPDTPAEVSVPLRRITATLQRLLSRVRCRTADQHAADAALRDAQTLQRCHEDVHEASILALRKCSLQMAQLFC